MSNLYTTDFKQLFENHELVIIGDVEVVIDVVDEPAFIKTRCITSKPCKEQWIQSGPIPLEMYDNPDVLRIWVISMCMAAVHLSKGDLHGKDTSAYHEHWKDMYVVNDIKFRPFIVNDVIFVYDGVHVEGYLTTSVIKPSFTLSLPLLCSTPKSSNEIKRLCGSFVDSHYKKIPRDNMTPADYGHLAQILIDQGWATFNGIHYGYEYQEPSKKMVLVHREIYGNSLHRNVYLVKEAVTVEFILRALLIDLRGKEIDNLIDGTIVKGKHPLIRYLTIPSVGNQIIYSTDLKDIEVDIVPSTRVTISEIKTIINKTWTDESRLNKRLAYYPRRVEENIPEEPIVERPRIKPFPKPEDTISTAPVMKISELPKASEIAVTLVIHGATIEVTFRSKSEYAVFAAAQEYLSSKTPIVVGENPHRV